MVQAPTCLTEAPPSPADSIEQFLQYYATSVHLRSDSVDQTLTQGSILVLLNFDLGIFLIAASVVECASVDIGVVGIIESHVARREERVNGIHVAPACRIDKAPDQTRLEKRQSIGPGSPIVN